MVTVPTTMTQASHGNVANSVTPSPPAAMNDVSLVPPNRVGTAAMLRPATT
jgi:hypothetical protein